MIGLSSAVIQRIRLCGKIYSRFRTCLCSIEEIFRFARVRCCQCINLRKLQCNDLSNHLLSSSNFICLSPTSSAIFNPQIPSGKKHSKHTNISWNGSKFQLVNFSWKLLYSTISSFSSYLLILNLSHSICFPWFLFNFRWKWPTLVSKYENITFKRVFLIILAYQEIRKIITCIEG